MSKFDFEMFQTYVDDVNITDINYNGKTLWNDHLKQGRYQEIIEVSDHEIESFCYRFANYCNKQFNNTYPILESETDELRISIIHKSVAQSGYSISIRKTPPIMRLSKNSLIESNYATKSILETLESLVKKRKNIIISGLPGVGKTELLKYLTSFIEDNQRVITIEDNLEIRFPIIHPQKDGLMIKVNDQVDYREAIKASLRQRVDWILLSEVRGLEVVELLQAVSTGASLISTIHAESAASIPQRILHMFPGNEITNEKLMYKIYESIDYGISIQSSISTNGIYRYIDEVVEYDVVDNNFVHKTLYQHNK